MYRRIVQLVRLKTDWRRASRPTLDFRGANICQGIYYLCSCKPQMTFMPYSVTLMLMQIITMYTEALDPFNSYNLNIS